jgi:hypothetical protein
LERIGFSGIHVGGNLKISWGVLSEVVTIQKKGRIMDTAPIKSRTWIGSFLKMRTIVS